MAASTDTFTISPDQVGIRLDKLLSLHFPQFSRTYFQYLIEQNGVLVNGEKLKKREKLEAGDEVEVCFLLTPELKLEPQNIPLDILYEDEHLIAVNKPKGMVVHPAPGNPSQTFVNGLLYHCKQLPEAGDALRPGIVHRLDKDTTGVLLAAKTASAHQQLVSLFAERKIEKHYLAICIGNPGDVLIDAPIGRHPVRRQEMSVVETGKEAKSVCKVLATNGQFSLAEVKLITGRTHQIRVHLKSRGCPVLGDPVYGSAALNGQFGVSSQCLHAWRVEFTHPITQKKLELKAPIPLEIRNLTSKFFNSVLD